MISVGGHAAGRDGNIPLHAPCSDFWVKARRDDEFCAAFQRLLALVERHDRTRADKHLWAAFTDRLDRIRRSRCAERDLHYVHAASK